MSVASYSQFGEDLQLAAFLGRRDEVTYVDVGCLWPAELSNTYFFYKRGGRGLCIDPNPDVADWFRNDRPRDVFANAAVGRPGGAQYVMHQNPVFNTCSEDRAAQIQRRSKNRSGRQVVRTAPAEVRGLDTLVRDSGFGATVTDGRVDLMSVDTNGMDLDVLESCSFEVIRPTVLVCAHRSRPVAAELLGDPVVRRMAAVGYALTGVGPSALYFHDGV